MVNEAQEENNPFEPVGELTILLDDPGPQPDLFPSEGKDKDGPSVNENANQKANNANSKANENANSNANANANSKK